MAGIHWADVSNLLGLQYYPNRRGPFGQQGFITGDLEGQLVTIGPAKTRSGSGVGILVQSPPITDATALRDALETDPTVRQVLGKEKKERVNLRSMLSIKQENLVLIWPFGLRPPSAEQVAALARAIATVVTQRVGERGRSCHRCGRPDAPIMLLNEVPLHLCNNCAETLRFMGNEAARAYAQKSPNLLLGLLFGAGAGLVSAVAWAVVSLVTERIFLLLAIGIGLFVAWAIHKGMGKFTRLGQAAAVLITLGSVLAGDLLYIALLLVQDGADLFRAILAVLLNLDIVFGESDIWVSLFFGLLGAIYISVTAHRAWASRWSRWSRPRPRGSHPVPRALRPATCDL
ncbi:MAG: hypothetical protein ACPLYD_08250 [Anaerolineae bacterium]